MNAETKGEGATQPAVSTTNETESSFLSTANLARGHVALAQPICAPPVNDVMEVLYARRGLLTECLGPGSLYTASGMLKDGQPPPAMVSDLDSTEGAELTGTGPRRKRPGRRQGELRVPGPAAIPAEAYDLPAPSGEFQIDELLEFNKASHPASLPPSLPPAIASFGRYELLGRIAVGGMAELFLAQQHIAGDAVRYVVVKLIKGNLADEEDFADMFATEGRVAMGLAHPNICHVYEFAKQAGQYYIAMEYVHGVTLRELVTALANADRRLPVPLALKVAADIAGALDYAHRAKDSRGKDLSVVHRDASPHNIMVSFEGTVKLLDFGIAIVTEGAEEEEGLARGKWGYMAPEQARGELVDGRADVFSLGVCLFEALTGKRLYKRGTRFETIEAILEEPAPSIHTLDGDLPQELAAIVARTLEKDPGDRFATAGALQEALSQYLADRRQVASPNQLRALMDEHFSRRKIGGLDLDTSPEAVARLLAAKAVESLPPPPLAGPMTSSQDLPVLVGEVPASKPQAAVIALGVVLALALVVGGFYFGSSDGVPASQDTIAAPPAPVAEPVTAADVEPSAPEPAVDPEPADVAEPEEPQTTPGAEDARYDPPSTMRWRPRRRPGFVADPGF